MSVLPYDARVARTVLISVTCVTCKNDLRNCAECLENKNQFVRKYVHALNSVL